MTLEREAYIAKCSDKEKVIRLLIKNTKREIKKRKEILNGGYDDCDDESDYHYFKIAINKVALQALRHELQRLKGMDEVVVPRQAMIFASPNENFNVGDMLGRCKCGQNLDSALMKFCPNCRRRILWEKVK